MSQQKTVKKPPYLMIAVMFIGTFVAFLNNTLLNIALPTIMEDFNIKDYATVQWLSTGYMLVSGILIPASAFLITRFKTRHLFILSMLIFTIGTAMAAFAPSFGILLTGRMIQAAGAAAMSPLLMNTMLISFPIEKRGKVMGFFGLAMFLAPAIGPTLSGWIVEHYHWSVLFEMILPFSVIALLLAIWKLDNVLPNRPVTIDYLSVVLSTVGFGGLLYGCSMASSAGWGDITVYGTIIIGIVAIVAFVVRQFKLEQPLLDLSTYKYPMFALASVIAAVNSIAMFSGMILTPAYIQSVRGIDPFEAGLMMLPGALLMGVMSPITGRLFDEYGPRILAVIGLAITTAATYMLTKLQLDTSHTYIIAVYTIRMFGISLVMMPIMTNGLNSIPQRLNPHGTAINNTTQQVAGAIGTAVLVTVFNTHTDTRTAELVANMKATGTLNGSQPTADQIAAATQAIKQQAMLDGINYTFFIATIISFIAFALTFFLKRAKPVKENS